MTKRIHPYLSVLIMLVMLALPSASGASFLSSGAWMGSPGDADPRMEGPENVSYNKVNAITAGNSHTCALMASGGIKCWGHNSSGQLGDGTWFYRSVPVDVSGLMIGVAAVSAGREHTCALTTGGGIKCWGNNVDGQLGDETTTNSLTPVDVSGLTSGLIAVAAGGYHTCALTSGGGIKCWGSNLYGQLGYVSAGTYSSTPVDVSDLTTGVVALSAGMTHTCVVMAGGGARCWGNNASGQLGDGSKLNRTTPVDVSSLTDGTAVAAGSYHTCALTGGGMAKCWGANGHGQLGDGTTGESTTPVEVSGLTSGVTAISAGLIHTCALTDTGGIQCWGSNTSGQLGDGTGSSYSSTPVDVSGLTTGAESLAVGYDHNCAGMKSGGAKCWGINTWGQLGDGTMVKRTTPVDVLFTAHLYLPIVLKNYCPSFIDDFSNPGSGWPVLDYPESRYEYLANEYRIWVKTNDWWAGAHPGFKASDYVVSVDVRNAGGVYGSYGLLFGLSEDWSQFYSFEVDSSGYYAIWRHDTYDQWALLAWGDSGSIQTGAATNQLKIERTGGQIWVYANGSLLISLYDGSYTGLRYVGLIATAYDEPNVDARFDNFTVHPINCGAADAYPDQAVEVQDMQDMEFKPLVNWDGGLHTRQIINESWSYTEQGDQNDNQAKIA
jgi:alpha-tubulin suppressor-like RCC1 family protein